jgi:hypothetical protein
MYKHRFDAVSFGFGVVFLALAAMFALPLDPWDVYFGFDLGWLLPAAVLVVGIALLVPILRGSTTVTPPSDTEELDVAHEDALAELEEDVAGPGF